MRKCKEHENCPFLSEFWEQNPESLTPLSYIADKWNIRKILCFCPFDVLFIRHHYSFVYFFVVIEVSFTSSKSIIKNCVVIAIIVYLFYISFACQSAEETVTLRYLK
jgi:hypothetical protein